MACSADLSASWPLMSPALAVRLLNGLNLRSDGSTMSLSFSVDKFSFLNQVRTHALACTAKAVQPPPMLAPADHCPGHLACGFGACRELWVPVACVCRPQHRLMVSAMACDLCLYTGGCAVGFLPVPSA